MNLLNLSKSSLRRKVLNFVEETNIFIESEVASSSQPAFFLEYFSSEYLTSATLQPQIDYLSHENEDS
jgi:hypothetical protein